jgi:MFS family permease
VSESDVAAERVPSPPSTSPEPASDPRRWRVLVVLAAVAFIAQLDVFIVNIAVPAIRASYPGTGLSAVSWVLNAYTVVFAALLVPAGRLADHFGRRRFLLAGVLIFTVGSALCAISPDLALLIAGRGSGRTGSWSVPSEDGKSRQTVGAIPTSSVRSAPSSAAMWSAT